MSLLNDNQTQVVNENADYTPQSAIVPYNPSNDPTFINKLLEQYDSLKNEILVMARSSRQNEGALEYFYRALDNSLMFKDMFNEKNAISALNSDFWGRVINATDVLQCMPAADRNKWSDMLRERKTPEFTEENIKNTITTLLMQRPKFLAQKVDGIFYNLSGKHVTNDPIGFGQRMIFSGMLDCYGYTNHRPCEYLDDLRSVINKLVGRTQKESERHSYYDVSDIKDEDGFGKWYRLDGGALKIKVFKKGTVHVAVHPDIAYLLNGILAEINGSVISSKSKSKVKFSPDFDKNDELYNEVLSQEVTSALRKAYEDLSRRSNYYVSRDLDKKTKKEIIEVLKFLDGIEDRGTWTFDYDVRPVLSEIVRMGVLPEKKSHQLFPTKPELAKRLVDGANIKKNDKVLEPSAGHGGIASLIESKNLTCVEINKLNCAILEQKGLNVINCNFLTWNPSERFDKIVMNPPFHFSQALDHVHKAFDLLKEGGEIHAILPASYNNYKIFNKMDCVYEYSEIIEDAFEDTGVSVVILKLTKK